MMRVNEAARKLGKSESWLRRAELRGLIPKARRDFNGWRVYTEEDVAVLQELLCPTSGGSSNHPSPPDGTGV